MLVYLYLYCVWTWLFDIGAKAYFPKRYKSRIMAWCFSFSDNSNGEAQSPNTMRAATAIQSYPRSNKPAEFPPHNPNHSSQRPGSRTRVRDHPLSARTRPQMRGEEINTNTDKVMREETIPSEREKAIPMTAYFVMVRLSLHDNRGAPNWQLDWADPLACMPVHPAGTIAQPLVSPNKTPDGRRKHKLKRRRSNERRDKTWREGKGDTNDYFFRCCSTELALQPGSSYLTPWLGRPIGMHARSPCWYCNATEIHKKQCMHKESNYRPLTG